MSIPHGSGEPQGHDAARNTKNPPRNSTALTPALALRPREAAAALGIGTRLLWEMTNRGEIPCVRIGRCLTYPVAQLEEWLARQAEGGER